MDITGTDFNLPSPKRIRVGQRDGDSRLHSRGPSQPGTPIDDLDDLYGDTPTGVPSPTKRSEGRIIRSECLQQPDQKPPKFQLPGLGLSTNDQCSRDISQAVAAANSGFEKRDMGAIRDIAQNDLATDPPPDCIPLITAYDPLLKDSAVEKEERVGELQGMQAEPAADALSGQEDAEEILTEPGVFTHGVDSNDQHPEASETLDSHSTHDRQILEVIHPPVCPVPDNNTTPLLGTSTSGGGPDKVSAVVTRPLEPQATHESVTSLDVVMGDSMASQHAMLPTDNIQLSKERPADNPNDIKSSLQPATTKSASVEAETGAPQLVPKTDQQMEMTAILKEGNDRVTDSTKMDLEAEFEMDSSPIESSSDSSSGSSSSDDSDDYQMLSPEEQARRLMQEDGGSDGEGAQDIGAGTAQLRTTNEKPDEVVPKPNITITPEMRIQELGNVENLVENLVLIKAKTSGEYQVLESGSVLCLADRSVIGVVSETLGRVEQPYYVVRFTNAASIAEAGISKGTSVFYSEKHSTTVFTQPLKAFKGSDASNIHDEEVADDEIEFSNDEAEAEYKKRMKQEKQNRKDARPGVPDGFSKGPGGRSGNRRRGRGNKDHRGGRSSDHPGNPNSGGMNYDDMETDEPYTPLARPSNLHEIMGRTEAPTESLNGRSDAINGDADSGSRGYSGGRGGRGRGDRSRGSRGGRGDQRERGGHAIGSHDVHSGNSDQYLQSRSRYPPTQLDSPFHHLQSQYQPPIPSPYRQQQSGYQYTSTQNGSHGYGYNNSPMNQQLQYPYQNSALQASVPNIPPGAFINPAFLAQAYQNPLAPQTPFPQQFSPNGSMSFPTHNSGQQPPFSLPIDDSPAGQERMRLLRDLARNLAHSHRTD